MTIADVQLVVAAILGIALAILMIGRWGFHPFLALLCGAFAIGLMAGQSTADTAKAIQKGAGDVLGGTGLVVALGLALGAILQLSDGAAALARAGLRLIGARHAPWASLGISLLLGLPLFFETGVVLLLPIVAAAATATATARDGDATSKSRFLLMLPAIAGLSTLHALVPPHPGPLTAVEALHADVGRTMLLGIMIAIPVAIIAGPLFAQFIAGKVSAGDPTIEPVRPIMAPPHALAVLAVILLPVILIALGELPKFMAAPASRFSWLGFASHPVLALTIATLVGLPLLFRSQMLDPQVQRLMWLEAMKPAGAIILAIGAGGALKQVLVSAGLSELIGRAAIGGHIPPLLLAWLVAVAVRLATGSATVATITTAGIVAPAIALSGTSPDWAVLAIGAGSIFFSHVNDPGFWLVKGYLGTSTADTFRTWSTIDTIISVLAIALILAGSHML